MSDNLNIIEAFSRLGIDEAQYQVYRQILQSPPRNLSQLAKQTRMSRGTLYNTLEILANKGLIQKTSNHPNKLKYTAANPEIIIDLLNSERTAFENLSGQIDKHVNFLKDLAKPNHDRNEPDVQIIRGTSTNDDLDKLIIRSGQPLRGFSYIYHLDSCFDFDDQGQLVANDYLDLVLQVSDKFVFPADQYTVNKIKAFLRKNPILKNKWFPRWLPKDEFKFNINFYSFGTYVAFALGKYNQKDYLAYIINNQEIASSMASLAEYMWNQAKPIN
jgi:DNA-binding MarR family transcriptional regulator